MLLAFLECQAKHQPCWLGTRYAETYESVLTFEKEVQTC